LRRYILGSKADAAKAEAAADKERWRQEEEDEVGRCRLTHSNPR